MGHFNHHLYFMNIRHKRNMIYDWTHVINYFILLHEFVCKPQPLFSAYIKWKSQQVFSFPLFLNKNFFNLNLKKKTYSGYRVSAQALMCSLMDTMWCSSSKLSMSLLAFRYIALKLNVRIIACFSFQFVENFELIY